MSAQPEFSRTQIINHLISLYGYRSYLEIGVQFTEWNFDHINIPIKDGVDPDPRSNCNYHLDSDSFFAGKRGDDIPAWYDLIFVDGLHTDEQVYKDIINSLDFLSPGGRIVVHDCNPKGEEWESTGKNGTVWRGWLRLRSTRPDLSMCVVDTDYGCGVIRRGGQVLYPEIKDPTYKTLSSDRIALLNLISVDEFLRTEGIIAENLKRNRESSSTSYDM